MKYRRLTIEELKELEKQFHLFLAAHSIPAEEWQKMKSHQAEKAEEYIEAFSDFIFEKVLSQIEFMEYRSSQVIQIVDLRGDKMQMRGLKVVGNQEIDFKEDASPLELRALLLKKGGKLQLITAQKAFSEDPNLDKFRLMQKGFLILKDPSLYETLQSLEQEE